MTTETQEQIEKSEKDTKPAELKTCFIVMPISNAEGYDPGHFNRVYEYIIKPACEAAGFKPSRADDTKHTNTIILDILNQIVKADMVLCDLSSKNPNVMYELGIRQAFNLPVVLIKDAITQRVFDTSSLRDIEYDHSLRIDNVNATVKKVTEALKLTYEMREKDTHSLISLLNIQPASLPEKKELSPEISLVLDEIRSLKENNDYMDKHTAKRSFSLRGGKTSEEEKVALVMEGFFQDTLKGLTVFVEHSIYGKGQVTDYNSLTSTITVKFDSANVIIEFPYSQIIKLSAEPNTISS
ncbi:hypothetical protein [Paenibacillus illinoisensis]|uniref:hypothetical protein n=1 Tax=Paenibacillus illinoisensis TaxID=59845 RepID=UPI00301CBB77